MIDQQLAAFLHDGVGIHLGTRDDLLQPNGARAISLQVEPDGRHFHVYISSVAAERVLPDLQANGLAAVVCGRPVDERACQVKGVFVEVRETRADERAAALAQWEAYLVSLERIGIPRASTASWITTPDLAIRLKATAVFDQTPGPNAGKAVP